MKVVYWVKALMVMGCYDTSILQTSSKTYGDEPDWQPYGQT